MTSLGEVTATPRGVLSLCRGVLLSWGVRIPGVSSRICEMGRGDQAAFAGSSGEGSEVAVTVTLAASGAHRDGAEAGASVALHRDLEVKPMFAEAEAQWRR